MMIGRYPATAASELSTPKARPAGSSIWMRAAPAPPSQKPPCFFVRPLFPFFIKTGEQLCLLQLQRSKRPVQEAKLYERQILKSKYCLSDIE